MDSTFISFIVKIGVICFVMGFVESQTTAGETTVTGVTGTGATGTGAGVTGTGVGVTEEIATTLPSVVSTAKPASTAASVASTAASVASNASSVASTAASIASSAATTKITTPKVTTAPTSVTTAKSPSKPLPPAPPLSNKELSDYIKKYFDMWLIQQGLKTKEPTTPKTTTTNIITKPLEGKDSVPRVPSKAPVQVSNNNFPMFNSRGGYAAGPQPPQVPTNNRRGEDTRGGREDSRYAASNRGSGYQQGSRNYYQQGSRSYQQRSRGYQGRSKSYQQESRTYQSRRYPRVRQISSRNFFQG